MGKTVKLPISNFLLDEPHAHADKLWGPYPSLAAATSAIPTAMKVASFKFGVLSNGVFSEYIYLEDNGTPQELASLKVQLLMNPASGAVAGKILSLDNELKPIWVDPSSTAERVSFDNSEEVFDEDVSTTQAAIEVLKNLLDALDGDVVKGILVNGSEVNIENGVASITIPDSVTSVIANNELVFQTPDGQSVKGKVGVTTGADGLLHLTLTDEAGNTYSSPIAGLRVVGNALQYSNDGETWVPVQTFGKLAIKYAQASDPVSGDEGDLALVGSTNAYVLKVYVGGSWVSVCDFGTLDLTSDGITIVGENKTLTEKINGFNTYDELNLLSATVSNFRLSQSTKIWANNSSEKHYWIPSNAGDVFKITGSIGSYGTGYAFLTSDNVTAGGNVPACSIYNNLTGFPYVSPNNEITIVAPSDAKGLAINKTVVVSSGAAANVSPSKIEKVVATPEDALHELVLMPESEPVYESIFDFNVLEKFASNEAVQFDNTNPVGASYANNKLTLSFTASKTQGIYLDVSSLGLDDSKFYRASLTFRCTANYIQSDLLCFGFSMGTSDNEYFVKIPNSQVEKTITAIVKPHSSYKRVYLGVTNTYNHGQTYEISALEIEDIVSGEVVYKTRAAQMLKELMAAKDGTFGDLQDYLNNSTNKDIYIPAGTYVCENLTIPNGTRIHGVPGVTIFKLNSGGDAIINLTSSSSDITIEGIKFVGNNELAESYLAAMSIADIRSRSGEGTENGIYCTGYAKRIVIKDCEFVDFGGCGIKLNGNFELGTYKDYFKILNCSFISNWCGLMLDVRSEFNTVIGCSFNYNQIGAFVAGGNNTFTGCRFERNGTGFVVSGTVANQNDSHGSVTTSTFNHCIGYAIASVDINNGYTFTGCHVFDGQGIVIANSIGFSFVGGEVVCPITIADPRFDGYNMFASNIFHTSYNGGTFEGDTSRLSLHGNRFKNQNDNSSINNHVGLPAELSYNALASFVKDEVLDYPYISWNKGAIKYDGGEEKINSNALVKYKFSDLIPVGGFNYVSVLMPGGTSAYGIAFYDASGNFVNGTFRALGANTSVGYHPRTYAVPAGASYMKFTAYQDLNTHGEAYCKLHMKGNFTKQTTHFFETFESFNASAPEGGKLEKYEVFNSGNVGGASRRIPSVVITNNGTVIAATEVRNSTADNSEVGIAIAKKTSNGEWSYDNVLPYDASTHVKVMNPCFVVDRTGAHGLAGRIFLFFLAFPKDDSTNNGYAANCTTEEMDCKYIYSDDDGDTWSSALSIKDAWDTNEWTWVGVSPANGFQAADGSLVLPCMGKYNGTWYSGIAIKSASGSWVFSKRSATASDNESTCFEYNGEIYLNCRVEDDVHKRTLYKYNASDNSLVQLDYDYDPNLKCQQSICSCKLPDDSTIYLQSANDPTSAGTRNRLTIWASVDGKMWVRVLCVNTPTTYGYSVVDCYNNKMALVYENTGTISFVDISYIMPLIKRNLFGCS